MEAKPATEELAKAIAKELLITEPEISIAELVTRSLEEDNDAGESRDNPECDKPTSP